MAQVILTEAEVGELPEDLRSGVTEVKGQDGKVTGFALERKIGDRLSFEDLGGLKSALEKERTNVRNLTTQLKPFEGIDPKKAKEAVAKVAEMANWDPDKEVAEKIKSREEQLVSKHNDVVKEKEGTITRLNGQLENLLVVSAATEAITTEKGNIKLLMPHVRQHVRMRATDSGQLIAEVIDKDGNPRVGDAQGNPMTIPQLIQEMKKSDDFAAAFEGTGNSGGGSGGSGTTTNKQKTVAGKIQVSRSDQRAMNDNWEKIASGEAVVVD